MLFYYPPLKNRVLVQLFYVEPNFDVNLFYITVPKCIFVYLY